MFTAGQLVAHAVGDYLLQSHWMATEKTRRAVPAVAHVATYAIPLLALRPSVPALVVMLGSHYAIDRYRLARYVGWLKNGARGEVTATGYPAEVPAWLSTWLLIITDNTLHVLINGAVLAALPRKGE